MNNGCSTRSSHHIRDKKDSTFGDRSDELNTTWPLSSKSSTLRNLSDGSFDVKLRDLEPKYDSCLTLYVLGCSTRNNNFAIKKTIRKFEKC